MCLKSIIIIILYYIVHFNEEIHGHDKKFKCVSFIVHYTVITLIIPRFITEINAFLMVSKLRSPPAISST